MIRSSKRITVLLYGAMILLAFAYLFKFAF